MKNSLILLIIKSLRPKQWVKNLFLFAGILFSKNILHLSLFLDIVYAFITFCLLSGIVYIANDIIDIAQDKRHPVKSLRPIASGKLKVQVAITFVIILLPLVLGVAFYLDIPFFIVCVCYLLLQSGYCFYFKHIVIIDIFSIAFGFLLRAIAGAVIIDVEISSWLLICTFLLALFLGLNKRRHELLLFKEHAINHRKILKKYNSYLLDQMTSVVSASTLLSYGLYTMSPETIKKFGTTNLIFTFPFVLYGILRYLYLIHMKKEGGLPENTIIMDKPLLINILLWILIAGIIIYC